MEQCGTVKKITGEYVEVEVKRSTACETCSAAHACPSAKRDTVVRALNDAGAEVGDRVKLVTPSVNVLWYAFAVFVFPLLLAFGAFAVTSHYVDNENYAILAAVVGFIVGFAVVFFTVERHAKKRGAIVRATEKFDN